VSKKWMRPPAVSKSVNNLAVQRISRVAEPSGKGVGELSAISAIARLPRRALPIFHLTGMPQVGTEAVYLEPDRCELSAFPIIRASHPHTPACIAVHNRTVLGSATKMRESGPPFR
jgi:hypothetical protein